MTPALSAAVSSRFNRRPAPLLDGWRTRDHRKRKTWQQGQAGIKRQQALS
eukprot:CAMPEP_0114619628 /NCGR_PEP_ID=MMETSP0168-20121206/8309_1 /TAXON_ID=95228 ORGANISM="Vannella sp., Strain DIVA3 517/6/12" /NCGR_SAMPLE_ID=MMETSP0168 /ASSEMBLY_ACC=CAM_ASM_000044 /LENGTH=49 /DNA_ID=CAMNT_0001830797 /DNA_START=19 /DNA_END=168 /DNA_ORIENTATION=+